MTPKYLLLIIPLIIKHTKKKTFSMSLSIYKGATYGKLYNARKHFRNLLQKEILKLPNLNNIRIHYVIYLDDQMKTNINTYILITDKFLIDTLIYFKKLPGNDYRYYKGLSTQFGSIDSKEPRIEVYIERLD